MLAPLGTARVGYRVGDTIEWTMPGGVRRARIENVRQPSAVRASAPSHVGTRGASNSSSRSRPDSWRRMEGPQPLARAHLPARRH